MKNVIEEDLIKESVYLRKRALKFTKDDVEAEDLLQDVLLKALSNMTVMENRGQLRNWLYTIMRNTYIDSKRKTRLNTELSEAHDILLDFNDGEKKVMYDDVMSEINKLSYKDRYLMKSYIKGFKQKDLAEKMSITEGTVSIKINKIKNDLKSNLNIYDNI